MATPQLLLSSLARAYSLSGTHFSGDPEYAAAIEAVREAHEGAGWVVLKVGKEGIWAGGELITDLTGEVGVLRDAMKEAGIQELRLQSIPKPENLGEFLRKLHPSSATEGQLPSVRFRGLDGELGLSFRPTKSRLPGMVGGIQELFHSSLPASDLLGGVDLLPGADGDAATGGSPLPVWVLSSELVKEVQTYLGSRDLHKAESEKRLRDGATELIFKRNAAAVSELVQLLAESGGNDPPDQDAVALAQDILTPAAASYLVAKIGAYREGVVRDHLVLVLSRLGKEGAVALADAVGEAPDRSDRRSYMDVLVKLGSAAYDVARGMLTDPRWYVVRNGVTVIGELGGEEAATHLKGPLANGDGRVRRESIRALARVGGPEAETLILGMLDDEDARVRVAACRALGFLGARQGVRPLLGRLKDSQVEVQLESIQALGLLGDPVAVPSIEKKALGWLFFRSPREVRITAFRALSSIGSPRALKVLQKGKKDRDEAVRTVVRSLKPGSRGR